MTLKEQIAWELEVSRSFADAVQHHRKMDITARPFDRIKETIIMSYLSDVQELMELGNIKKANDMVNRVKYITTYETEGSVHNTLLVMDNVDQERIYYVYI